MRLDMKIKLFSPLRDIAGTSELKVDPGKNMVLIDLLRTLSAKYGNRFKDYIFEISNNKQKIRTTIVIILNGRRITPSQSDIMVNDNDVLAILPAVSGG
jgi:MoaD family protein